MNVNNAYEVICTLLLGSRVAIQLPVNFFYMKKSINQNLDDLIQGIKSILSENRCSLSDKDKVLLQNCLNELERHKKENSNPRQTILKVVESLLAFWDVAKFVIDLF